MISREWRTTTVQEFVENGEAELKTGPFGTQLHASDYVQQGTPVINVRNIGFGGIVPEKLEFLNDETVARLRGHLLRKCDIVFGRKGAVERHAFIREEQDGWFQGSDCLRLRIASDGINPQFLSYVFLTDSHKQWMMNQCSHGATMASLNQAIIARIPLRLPDISVQNRIVSVLSGYDDLIENNTRRIKILEQMAQMLYREWFVNFRFPGHEKVELVTSGCGEIPKSFTVLQLADICTVLRGRSYKGNELSETDGLPFINLKCINRDGGFRLDGIKRYTGAYKASQIARPGDIVMAVTDMTQERRIVARSGRVPALGAALAVFSMDLVKVQPKVGVANDYLYSLLRFSTFADSLKEHANGANVLHLNPSLVEQHKLPVPSEELRNSFAEAVTPMYELIALIEQKNTNLRTTRDMLLPKLVSGEVSGRQIEKEAVAQMV